MGLLIDFKNKQNVDFSKTYEPSFLEKPEGVKLANC